MTKSLLIPIAFTAVASPSLAAAVEGVPFSFEADGKHFDVVRLDTPRGAILTGVDSNRNHFRLEVVGRQVSGFYGNGAVAYSIAEPLAPRQRLALK